MGVGEVPRRQMRLTGLLSGGHPTHALRLRCTDDKEDEDFDLQPLACIFRFTEPVAPRCTVRVGEDVDMSPSTRIMRVY